MTAVHEWRLAIRTLAKTPGFTLTCVLVLAFGIAISTAAFAVVNTAVKHPLPFRNAERLALIRERQSEKGVNAGVSYPAFRDWRERSNSFQELGALEPRGFNLSAGAEPESVSGALATAGFFRALSWQTVSGRGFTSDEERPGGARAVLISQRCWERRFGSDPGIVGRELVIDGETATVVGVLSRLVGRSYYSSYEVWMPLRMTPDRASRALRNLEVVGLLKPGAGFAQAGSELGAMAKAQAGDPAARGWGVLVMPMTQIMAHTMPMYVVLLTITGLLLVIVCANIATLQLARAAGRQPEIAIRVALGATRGRIIRHLLAEGVVLAAAGGIAAVLLASGVRQLLVANVPELAELRLDGAVLGFTMLVSAAAALLFGLSPALSASKFDVNGMLKNSGRTLPPKAVGRTRAVLVVCQMAVMMTLLTGLGLLIRTFIGLHHADVGFRADNLAFANVTLPKARATPAQSAAFVRMAVERLAGTAGVQAAAAVSTMPLAGGGRAIEVETEGRARAETVQGQYTVAMPEYFRAMEIPIRRGRAFAAGDTGAAPAVVIVNERAAGLFWPGNDAVGKRVRLNGSEWRTVIAVAGDVRQDLLRPPAPEFYVPYAQDPRAAMWIVVRTGPEAGGFLPGLRAGLRALEPGLRIGAPMTMDDVISGYFPGSLVAGIGAFCAAALFFAVLGLYGVVSYLAAQRTHEFGVRIALGADARDVRRLVMADGLKLAGWGAAVGLAGGAGLARLLSGLLVGVPVSHPLVFAAVAAVLAAVVLGACYAPARRAMHTSPAEALRYQ
jgi:putative ABC transport system permease protein